MTQNSFTGWATQRLSGKSNWFKSLALMAALLALGALHARGQTFASPVVLPGTTWGSNIVDNTGYVGNTAPVLAGFTPHAPVWFQWVAPQDGDVQLDTYGSHSSGGLPIDTLLGVFTGTDIAKLTQLAVNDDVFPDAASGLKQVNEAFESVQFFNIINPVPPFVPLIISLAGSGTLSWNLPVYGPSGLHFNAKAGAVYYFVVDSKINLGFPSTGSVSIHWAYHSAGVFRIATEYRDATYAAPYGFGIADANGSPMLLIECAESEGTRRNSGTFEVDELKSTIDSYYFFDVPGMMVTVTRVAGSSGRVEVGYTNIDGDVTTVQNGDMPAVRGLDYTPRSGTLVFDDYEMSKTIWIPITDRRPPSFGVGSEKSPASDYVGYLPNRDFFFKLTGATTDPSESPDVSDARLDPVCYQADCRILDCDVDPNGPSSYFTYFTNTVVGVSNVVTATSTNLVTVTNTFIITNTIYTLVPTNAVFNFQKAHYRVPRDVMNSLNGRMVTLYVNRSGTNQAAASIFFRVNAIVGANTDVGNEQDYHFPLQPGSDYAIPTPPNANTPIRAKDSDFQAALESGTLSWAAKKFDSTPIKFSITNNNETKFNKDFLVTIYDQDPGNTEVTIPVGEVSEATVTILTDDLSPPAGAVDEYYNPDFGLDMAPPVNSTPPQMVQPGTDGDVLSVALMSNDEALIAGRFFSYDLTARNSIALVTTNGSLDTSFNPGNGVDAFDSFIEAVAINTNLNKILIAGEFQSYDGTPISRIARVNMNGTLDSSFNPGTGANGTIYAMKLLSDGSMIIGGDFTTYNDVPRAYLARLKADGTLDTTFDPKDALNHTVYALDFEGSTHIAINRNAAGTDPEDDNSVNVGATAGTLTVDYDFQQVPDDMRVFYGGTNNVLIFDTGLIPGTGHLVIPFGPTNGLTTNVITIVMNQGNGIPGTAWSYTASVDVPGANQVTVGGDFTSVNGIEGQDHIARFLGDGSVDTTFDPFAGANATVRSVALQLDGKVIIGGDFTQVNGQDLRRCARLNVDGTIDTDFFNGTGMNSTVYNINVVNNFTFLTNGPTTNVVITVAGTNTVIYVGGSFDVVNGTHRLGFARLYSDGSVDTTFLDTAYNQFAGLSREFYVDTPGAVHTSAVQSDGRVMIGGAFEFVGGGAANWKERPDVYGNVDDYGNEPLWVSQSQANLEPKARDGVRNRSNIARLIGGATPGPGSIGLVNDTYSVNSSQSTLFVSLVRSNGFLGPAAVNFQVAPGLAQPGVDYSFLAADPVYWVAWQYQTAAPTRMHEDGYYGLNSLVTDPIDPNRTWVGTLPSPTVTVTMGGNTLNGDTSATFQLANPSGADWFYLGGENIPLGVALARSTAKFSIIDDHKNAGDFGFSAPSYTGIGNPTTISVVRSNSTSGNVTVNFATTTVGSTAVLDSDYRATNGTLTFQNGDTSRTFNVTILNSNYISSVEKNVNLKLSNLQVPANTSATFSLSNAVLRIINQNFQGFLDFTTNMYTAPLSAGSISLLVSRTVGSRGAVTVQCGTYDDSAFNGTDYIGTTNTLQWNSGDVDPKTITIPLLNSGNLSGSKQFKAWLFNPQTNGVSNPTLLGLVTNATLVINNDNSYGTFQFTATNYVMNENGNYATLTVSRIGSSLGSAQVNFGTSDGTAKNPANYSQTNGTLFFADGQTAQSFRVYLKDDGVTNMPPNLFYFNATLSSPSLGAALGSPAVASVDIVDTESYIRPPGDPDVTFDSGTGMNDDVLALALQSNGQIIAGGNFTLVNGTPRHYVARLHADGGLDGGGFLSGLTAANGPVRAVASQTDDRVVVAGSFTLFNNIVRNYIARLNTDGSLDSTFNPGGGANNVINSVVETFIGGTRFLYAGGDFTSFNGSAAFGVVRLNDHGTGDSSFNTGIGANGAVFAVATYPTNSIYAGKVLVGGAFNNFNNHNVGYFARLNSDGSVDTNFITNLGTGANNNVRCIAVQDDGAILLGGDFTNFNGTAVNRIARIKVDGTLDLAFGTNAAPGVDNVVNAIAVQADGRIVLAGNFTQANGVTRNRITRLMPDGTVDSTVNFGEGANGAIESLVIQPANQMLVLGGAFTQFQSQTNYHIARIYGGSMTGSGAFQFTSANYQVNENGSVGVVKILRTGGTSGPNSDGSGNISVTFQTSDGTARNGANYIGSTNIVSFPPGEVLREIFVPVLDDSNITAGLTVNMAISNPTPPAGMGLQPNAVLTILNVDSALAFSSAHYTVAKNVPSHLAHVDITRVGGTNGTCTASFTTTTNGTAIDGTDYRSTNALVTFNPGDRTRTVGISIISNTIPEGIRTVTLALTNSSGAFLQSPTNAVLSIFDNVFSPGFFFIDTNVDYVYSEGDANAYLTVLRTNGSSGSVTLHFRTVAGTAAPGVNYVDTDGHVTFPDTISSEQIAIPLMENSLVQGTVQFSVYLYGPDGGSALTDPTNATVSIKDDEFGAAFLSITNFCSESITNAATATVFVQRIGDTNVTFSVDFGTTNGTAQAGINFSNTVGTLTFTNGEVLKSILVPLIYDPMVTGDLSFTMGLSNPTAGGLVTAPAITTVVIHDADAGISFTNATLNVFKNAGAAVITVVCSNPSVEPPLSDTNAIPISVNYFTTNGTALAGLDYIATSGTMIFSNGIATNTFTVPLLDNLGSSGDRTFNVMLANVTAPGQLVAPTNLLVTIVDSMPLMRFSSASYTVQKSGVSANITVFRKGFTNNVASVDFLATNGTAQAGINFAYTNGTLIFTNGEMVKTFRVPIFDNNTPQPNKTVSLQLLNPTNSLLTAPSAATLTILDASGSLVIPAGSVIVTESGPTNGYIDPNETVSLMFGFRDAGGTNVSDLHATLLATNGVTSPSGSQDYGPLTVYGPAVSRQFSFTAVGTNNQQITATFNLFDGVKNLGQGTFIYTIGSMTNVFWNPQIIYINDVAIASPYPSTITVSNVGYTLLKATVTLTNITHGSMYDIGALVVSPTRADTLLMHHAGTPGVSGQKVTLTFDDDAATVLPPPGGGAVTTSTNKPSAYPLLPVFP